MFAWKLGSRFHLNKKKIKHSAYMTWKLKSNLTIARWFIHYCWTEAFCLITPTNVAHPKHYRWIKNWSATINSLRKQSYIVNSKFHGSTKSNWINNWIKNNTNILLNCQWLNLKTNEMKMFCRMRYEYKMPTLDFPKALSNLNKTCRGRHS